MNLPRWAVRKWIPGISDQSSAHCSMLPLKNIYLSEAGLLFVKIPCRFSPWSFAFLQILLEVVTHTISLNQSCKEQWTFITSKKCKRIIKANVLMSETRSQALSRLITERGKIPSFRISVHCPSPVCSQISWTYFKSHQENLLLVPVLIPSSGFNEHLV